MFSKDSQKDIKIDGDNNKIVKGNNTENHFHGPTTKLSNLFACLKTQFENQDNEEEIRDISDSLSRYLNPKDTLGLEKKLELQGKAHFEEDFSELKQLFSKKLHLYRNYEPAREIFTFLLAIILEKYRNVIKPLIRDNATEKEILQNISEKIIDPINSLIQSEGCDDIMGLNSEIIEGMYHYLTGNCHINWVL
ncbi:ABC-three component system protein [Flavobacterium bizetiae]|uniref:ABC-three component system protein n=1 Tax=Flavobacterium bizetiae TaxID=2704140 RepID=UPI00375716E9